MQYILNDCGPGSVCPLWVSVDLPPGCHGDRALLGLRAFLAPVPLLCLQLQQDVPLGPSPRPAQHQRRHLPTALLRHRALLSRRGQVYTAVSVGLVFNACLFVGAER